MLLQVSTYQRRLFHCKFQLAETGELRPPETEGTVSMAGLSLAGKEKHGFTVLVLYASEFFAVERGDVMFELTGRMRVHCMPDLVNIPCHIRFTSPAIQHL